ncbi:hypothetical protein D0N36_06750 [Hymenobacter lapidiphilus]|nr:hypothetical protein D0N36_06750 [Hymenobacter sp. CCM 8763]
MAQDSRARLGNTYGTRFTWEEFVEYATTEVWPNKGPKLRHCQDSEAFLAELGRIEPFFQNARLATGHNR